MITRASRAPLVASARKALRLGVSARSTATRESRQRAVSPVNRRCFSLMISGRSASIHSVAAGRSRRYGRVYKAGRQVEHPVTTVLYGLGNQVVDQFGAGHPPPPVARQAWCGRGDRVAPLTGKTLGEGVVEQRITARGFTGSIYCRSNEQYRTRSKSAAPAYRIPYLWWGPSVNPGILAWFVGCLWHCHCWSSWNVLCTIECVQARGCLRVALVSVSRVIGSVTGSESARG